MASPPALCTYVVDELDWFLPSEQFGLMCASPCGDVDVASVRVDEAKPFKIPKREVWEAFKRVKVNQGAAGVDGQSIAAFEANLSGNLYKLWNRMSSGSYFPPPVRRVDIPKAGGGTRPLGIPKDTSTVLTGSCCSRRFVVIRTARGCCSTSNAG